MQFQFQGPIGEMKDKDVMAPSSTVKDGMLAELDLRLTMEQYNTLYQSTSSSRSVSSRQKRKVVTDTRTRWPGAVVPYEIKGEDFSKCARNFVFRHFFCHIEAKS